MLFLWASRETSYLNKLLCMPQLKHMNYFEQICIDLQLTLDWLSVSIHFNSLFKCSIRINQTVW